MIDGTDFAALLCEALDEQIEAQTQLAALCDAQTGAIFHAVFASFARRRRFSATWAR